jgi:cysteine desulfurase
VLKALGRKTELALASLRFGLGRWTTEEEVDFAVSRVTEVVSRLRAMSPA